MFECYIPTTCCLTDKNGKIVSPYQPNSITYKILASLYDSEQNQLLPSCSKVEFKNIVKVLIQGYVAYYFGGESLSAAIPFSIIKCICVNAPKESELKFSVKWFNSSAFILQQSYLYEAVGILIDIDTKVCCIQNENTFDCPNCICDSQCEDNDILCHSFTFNSNLYLTCTPIMLDAEVYQYNTIADGQKRIYTNEDELKEYGDKGIFSPDEVSYYNVFVNGVLQPQVNYILSKGVIEFVTVNVPPKGEPINILFVTFKDKCNRLLKSENNYYNTVSDGVKRIYTNDDELIQYGNKGIPNVCEVSFFNLYINGVLQPTTNFKVKNHILILKTVDIPLEGSKITLESVLVRGFKEQLLKAQTTQYNAYSDEGKVYTNRDRIRLYDSKRIQNPQYSSLQNLYVNGVIQPEINFNVKTNFLSLKTEDVPILGAPITLQSIKAEIIEKVNL